MREICLARQPLRVTANFAVFDSNSDRFAGEGLSFSVQQVVMFGRIDLLRCLGIAAGTGHSGQRAVGIAAGIDRTAADRTAVGIADRVSDIHVVDILVGNQAVRTVDIDAIVGEDPCWRGHR